MTKAALRWTSGWGPAACELRRCREHEGADCDAVAGETEAVFDQRNYEAREGDERAGGLPTCDRVAPSRAGSDGRCTKGESDFPGKVQVLNSHDDQEP